MKNFCRKCGAQLDGDTGMCPNCDINEAGMRPKSLKKKKRPIFKFFVMLLVLAVLGTGIISSLVYFEKVHIPAIAEILSDTGIKPTPEALAKEAFSCIIVEEGNITMTNPAEGSIALSITLPDYVKLYQEAAEARMPERYLFKALQNKTYNTVTIEEAGTVTVTDGIKTIHTEEAIKRAMEKELLLAIAALGEDTP